MRDVFGIEPWTAENPFAPGLTAKQVELFLATFQHRRVTCRSGHGTGKSFILALILITWLYVWQGLVVTTASTWDQVEKVLWREVSKMYGKALIHLPAMKDNPLLTELKVTKEWWALGRSTDNPDAFQGVHDPNLLVIVDEACGVPDVIHEAASSLCTGKHNHIVEVSNPTSIVGEFYEHHRRGTWHKIHISCYEHPNVVYDREIIPGAVTVEWIAEMEERWGKDSPVFMARVEGQFPVTGTNSVFPVTWVERSQDAVPPAEKPKQQIVMAVDVARYGENKTVVALRKGQTILPMLSWSGKNTMETTGEIIRIYEEHKPSVIVVDVVGLGGGVVDRLVEQGYPVLPYHSGMAAIDRRQFLNRRSERSWRVREALERGELFLPKDKFLRDEMVEITYKVESSGKIKIESKEDMIRRGVASPDHADAVVMTFVTDVEIEEEVQTQKPNPDQDPNLAGGLNPEEQFNGGAFAQLGYGF